MREIIQTNIHRAKTLDEISRDMELVFKIVKPSTGLVPLGYVSGIITSDGPEFMQRNIDVLAAHTQRLRAENNFPLFSPTDVFTDEVFARIDAFNIPQPEWLKFWEGILRMGYVTHVFMTSRWQKSSGARDEYRVAKELGLVVCEVK